MTFFGVVGLDKSVNKFGFGIIFRERLHIHTGTDTHPNKNISTIELVRLIFMTINYRSNQKKKKVS